MKRTIGTIVVVIVFFAVDIAFALTGVTTAPTSGAGFDFYDLIVNKIIQGPIGMTGAVGGIAWGSSQLFRSNLVPCFKSSTHHFGNLSCLLLCKGLVN